MMIRWNPFNIYLLLLLAMGVTTGCKTEGGHRKKILASFRLYQETTPTARDPGQKVTVGREHPIRLNIERDACLTENMVKEAKVLEVVGGYALQVTFDARGAWLLEQFTAALRGKRLVVFSQFHKPSTTDENLSETRWLAAPKVTHNISDGTLVFSPDATREEADMIATGLNNVVKLLQKGEPVKW
jgi:hypothetical protein